MLRICLSALAILLATSAYGKPKDMTWMALQGDTLNLNGRIMRVHGVSCPPSSQPAGLYAKRLANTFLRGGLVVCVTSRTKNGRETVDCAKQGNNGFSLSQMLVFTALCTPRQDQECLMPHFDAMPIYEPPPRAAPKTPDDQAN
jgi:hypothetical protein